QVEHERALVAVEVEEDVPHFAVPRRLGIAHEVTVRRLDLDHLGTKVTQDLRRERPQYDRRQIKDFDTGERPRPGFRHCATSNMIIPSSQLCLAGRRTYAPERSSTARLKTSGIGLEAYNQNGHRIFHFAASTANLQQSCSSKLKRSLGSAGTHQDRLAPKTMRYQLAILWSAVERNHVGACSAVIDDCSVAGQQGEALGTRLRNQHSVERITMPSRQGDQCLAMIGQHRKQIEAI